MSTSAGSVPPAAPRPGTEPGGDPTGARRVARSTRRVSDSLSKVAERELGNAVRVSTELRDELIPRDRLERARGGETAGRLREHGHSLVDLAFDASAVLMDAAADFLDRFAESRPDPQPEPQLKPTRPRSGGAKSPRT